MSEVVGINSRVMSSHKVILSHDVMTVQIGIEGDREILISQESLGRMVREKKRVSQE